jgi:hypothetical protein
MALTGKGVFIWQLKNCEGGRAEAIAAKAAAANLTHVLIKIADTNTPFGLDRSGNDLVPAVVNALKNRGIQAWGWHYVKGDDPLGEARIAVQRSRNLRLDGYVIDAEIEYRTQAKAPAARSFMNELRAGLPRLPIAFSSFRYPSFHQALPWREFLEKCDLNMPQVYWEQAHNPDVQLARSVSEFANPNLVGFIRPVLPTGSAYGTGGWRATPDDLTRFFRKALELNLTAANAYSWDWATSPGNTDLWDAIAGFEWPMEPGGVEPAPTPEPARPAPGTPPQPPAAPDILVPYFQALNNGDVDALTALYQPNAAHVTAARTVIGTQAIRDFYADLLNRLPGAVFSVMDSSGQPPTRIFSWTASNGQNMINDGNDTLGLREGKIQYHYTRFTVG